MNSALQVVGGLGLFLLGMAVMTGGLKALAGRAVRRAVRRFTRSPTSGAVTGAVTTALVQSSSATTVTAVGFVGAGLLTFPMALGVIFGANIGTTITGWLVALVGFKLSLGTAVLPFIFVGALLHILASGRWSKAGLALAGFGLIFVGIATLQDGLAAAEGALSPDTFPSDTIGGRLLMVLLGAGITILTQSSSAGVATALAAVSAGTISFPQAAALVIGMDIGTTVTAALATIGGSSAVRRTGFAHVIYNLLTGIVAFALLVPYSLALENLSEGILVRESEFCLVGFHTFFNGIGVVLVLPFAGRFAAFMEALFPDAGDSMTARLERRLLGEPAVALAAAMTTLRELSLDLVLGLERFVKGEGSHRLDEALPRAHHCLRETRQYLSHVHTTAEDGNIHQGHLALMHMVDHLDRLLTRCDRLETECRHRESDEARAASLVLQELCHRLSVWLESDGNGTDAVEDRAAQDSAEIGARIAPYRKKTLVRAVGGEIPADDVDAHLDALRWHARVGHHLWRLAHHLLRAEASLREGRGDELVLHEDAVEPAEPDG